jgi:hypothetical protein
MWNLPFIRRYCRGVIAPDDMNVVSLPIICFWIERWLGCSEGIQKSQKARSPHLGAFSFLLTVK